MHKLFRPALNGLLGVLLLGCFHVAFARQGGVAGAVTDQANAAVANASVELINLTSNSIRSVRVDASGKYSFGDVSPGQYRLVVKAPGYNDTGRTITVEGAPLTEDFQMSVGNIKEVITVTADRGLRADADIPLNVTVETAQTIEEKLPVSPGEILKDTPSLFVFNSNSPLSSPNLRACRPAACCWWWTGNASTIRAQPVRDDVPLRQLSLRRRGRRQ